MAEPAEPPRPPPPPPLPPKPSRPPKPAVPQWAKRPEGRTPSIGIYSEGTLTRSVSLKDTARTCRVLVIGLLRSVVGAVLAPVCELRGLGRPFLAD